MGALNIPKYKSANTNTQKETQTKLGSGVLNIPRYNQTRQVELTPESTNALKGLMGTNKVAPTIASQVPTLKPISLPKPIQGAQTPQEFNKQEAERLTKKYNPIQYYAGKVSPTLGSVIGNIDTGIESALDSFGGGIRSLLGSKINPEAQRAEDIQKEKYPIASNIGSLLGYINPKGVAAGIEKAGASLLGKAANTFKGKVASSVLGGAGLGLVEGATEGLKNNLGVQGTLQNMQNKATEYGLLGGGGAAAIGGISKGISKLKTNNALNKIDEAYNTYKTDGLFGKTTLPKQTTLSIPTSQVTESILKPANALDNINSPLDNIKPVKTQNTSTNIIDELSNLDTMARRKIINQNGYKKHNIATNTLNDGDRIFDPNTGKSGTVQIKQAANGMDIMAITFDDGTKASYNNMNWLLKEDELLGGPTKPPIQNNPSQPINKPSPADELKQSAEEIKKAFEDLGSGFKEASAKREMELLQKQGYVGFRKKEAAEMFKNRPDRQDWVEEFVDGEYRFKPSNNVPDTNVGSKPINFDAIKTIDDLPTDEIGLRQFIQETEKQIKNGLVLPEMNLQLFAEAQRRLKQRKFASNSIINAEVIPAEMKQAIAKNMPEYEPITNKETWNSAVNKVNDNLKSSIDEWKSLDSVKSADDTALGQALMVDAIKKGDVSTANEIAYELAEKLTKAGQTVQAASILKRLSPEGMLTHVNRTLQKAERELGDKFKGKLKLTDAEANEIADRMKKMKEMADGREKDIEFAKIQKIVSDKIPPTMREKLKALQRINLLLNPKTMIRNIGGNIIGSALANTKDVLKAGLDKGISKVFKTERTSLLPSLTTQAKGGVKGFKNTIQDAKMGIDTSNLSGQFELNTQRMGSLFKSKIFKKADELTRTGLRLGDSPFYQATYDDVLRQQMKIKGVTEATPEMKLMAENEAKVRTWQDTNKYTEFFDSIRNGLNKVGVKGFGLGDVVLPFTKTPANILKAGVEYSPLNIINVANNAVKFAKTKGSLDQYKLVDSLAKTLTGTGLLGAGIYFAQKGLITSKAPTDYDAASFQKEQGILPYALKIGDKSISFDWAQPASIPIAMGADIYNNYKNSKNPQGAIIDGVKGGLGTLFSQSMVQGLQKLFSSFDSSGNGLMDNLENAGYNSILQLLPFNSLTRQIAEVKDPFNRSTYEDTSIESKLTNQAKRSLPILRETLPQKFKTTGEAEKSRGWFNTLFNPANVGAPQLNSTKKEILRLYNDSGEKIQFPRIADKTITPPKKDGKTFEKIQLDGKQRSEYQKMLGEETMKSFKKIINQPNYNKLSDVDKAKKLQGVITDSDKLAKKNLIKNLQLPLKPKK